MVIFEKMYDGNNIDDIWEDIYFFIDSGKLDIDSTGTMIGHIKMSLEYKNGDINKKVFENIYDGNHLIDLGENLDSFLDNDDIDTDINGEIVGDVKIFLEYKKV